MAKTRHTGQELTGGVFLGDVKWACVAPLPLIMAECRQVTFIK